MTPNIDMDRAVRCIVIGLVLGIIVIGYPGYEPVPQITAKLTAYILGCFIGAAPAVHGNIVFLKINNDITALDISPECSALVAMLVFISVMFITPGIKLKHRLYSLLLVPVLYAVNLFRITSETFVGSISNIRIMSIYHVGVGQIVFFSAMILLYIGFLKAFGYLHDSKRKT